MRKFYPIAPSFSRQNAAPENSRVRFNFVEFAQESESRIQKSESVAQRFMMGFVNDFRDSDAGDTRKGILMTSKSLSNNSVF